MGIQMKDIERVVTHRTQFHADDVFGVAMMRLIKPEVEVARVFQEDLENYMDDHTLIFDIGLGEYDHHQKEGKALRPIEDGTYRDSEGNQSRIPYCGFGLLWRDFGYLLCPNRNAWKKVDATLVLGIDKNDNGVSQNLLSASIRNLNPVKGSGTDEDEAFMQAAEIAKALLKGCVDHANAAIAAIEDVVSCYDGGPVLVMREYLPWADAVQLDERLKDVMFAVYPSQRGGFNVQTIAKKPGSMEKRMLFPNEWLGHADPERGITFAHTSNYLIACETIEQAVAAAEEAVAIANEPYRVAYSV